jgi:hypothetical protein
MRVASYIGYSRKNPERIRGFDVGFRIAWSRRRAAGKRATQIARSLTGMSSVVSQPTRDRCAA